MTLAGTAHVGDTTTVLYQIDPDGEDLTGATVVCVIVLADETRYEIPAIVNPTVNGVAQGVSAVGCAVGTPSPWGPPGGQARCQFQISLGGESWSLDEFSVYVLRAL